MYLPYLHILIFKIVIDSAEEIDLRAQPLK